ncbi:LOW QUALITY PROTEIN: cell wall-associated hydrolase, partial [Rhodococcus opacus PD630]
VLGAAPLSSPAPTADRDRTVSRRSKPSSRTTLNGEQPYPWDLPQPQDVMSRHRGAKHRRRYELLGGISLLSPEYLLSVER